MSYPGTFIVFEGIDGTGKTTHAKKLAERLRAEGVDVVEVHDPGGTALGDRLREILLHGGEDLPICRKSELLLYLAARAQLTEDVIVPALERGAVVIADRFHLSTLVYQGVGRNLEVFKVADLSEFASNLWPDATLLLSIPAAVSAKRLVDSGKAADRLESDMGKKWSALANAYEDFSYRFRIGTSPVIRVETFGSPEEVGQKIYSLITDKIGRKIFPWRGK